MVKMKKYLQGGMALYGGALAVGAMPTMGNANAAAIQGNVGAGMAQFSTAFPTVGALAGTGVVIGSTKKLINSTGSLTRRRKRR